MSVSSSVPTPEPEESVPGDPRSPLSPRRHRRRRSILIAGVLTIALVLAAGAVAASVARRSAAQQPDTAIGAVTGRVVRGEVIQKYLFDATVVAAWQTTVAAPTSTDAGRLVVNYLPRVSSRVRAGQRVAEVSGRPVILLTGKVPAYRDLHVGDEGADVTQLQSALRQVGCSPTDRKGRLGTSTASCLAWLYRRAGSSLRHEETPAGAEPGASDGGGATEPAGGANSDIVVPWTELLFEPYPTVTVSAHAARVGQVLKPEDPMLTLTNGALAAVVTTDGGPETDALHSGAAVTLVSDRLGALGGGVAEPTSDPTKIKIRFTSVDKAHVAQLAPGQGLQASVVAARSEADALTVPVGALTTTGTGEPAVETLTGDPPVRGSVPVTVVLVANGRAAVEPVVPGTLVEGQRIVIAS
jgi:hypothetical protein